MQMKTRKRQHQTRSPKGQHVQAPTTRAAYFPPLFRTDASRHIYNLVDRCELQRGVPVRPRHRAKPRSVGAPGALADARKLMTSSPPIFGSGSVAGVCGWQRRFGCDSVGARGSEDLSRVKPNVFRQQRRLPSPLSAAAAPFNTRSLD